MVGDSQVNSDSTARLALLRLILTLFWLLPAIALGQPSEADTTEPPTVRFRLSAGAGYATYALRDVKGFFDDGLRTYHDQNIPIEAQRTYPGNLMLGMDFLLSLSDQTWTGLGGWYTWTSAYAKYEDYSGTLDITSHVRLLNIQAITRWTFAAGNQLQIFLEPRGGIGICTYEATEEVHLTYLMDSRSMMTVKATGTRFTAELYGGLEYDLGSVQMFVKGGYRFAEFSDLDGEITQSSGGGQSGTLGFKVDMSGVSVLAGVSLNL